MDEYSKRITEYLNLHAKEASKKDLEIGKNFNKYHSKGVEWWANDDRDLYEDYWDSL